MCESRFGVGSPCGLPGGHAIPNLLCIKCTGICGTFCNCFVVVLVDSTVITIIIMIVAIVMMTLSSLLIVVVVVVVLEE